MAGEVSNAIGTQKNFTPQPQNTYERRVVPVIDSSGRPSSLIGASQKLAEQLGVLEKIFAEENVNKEKRLEKEAVYEVTHRLNSLTPEEREKLNTIDLLATEGQIDISGNPYAFVLAEEARGKYFSDKASTDYTSWRLNQPPTKTPEEEAARYNKFLEEYYSEGSNNAEDSLAYKRGFYENYNKQETLFKQKSIKERDASDMALLVGQASADLKTLASDLTVDTPEEWYQKVVQAVTPLRIAGVTAPQRIKVVEEFLNTIATQSGEVTLLDLVKDVPIGVTLDDKEIAIKDVVSVDFYKNMAGNTQRRNFDLNVQDFLNAQEEKTVAEINDNFEKLRESDQTLFTAVAPYRDNLINNAKKAEKLKKQQIFNANARDTFEVECMMELDSHFKAFVANEMFTTYGSRRAVSVNDFKKIPHLKVNSEGIASMEEVKIPNDMIETYVKGQLNAIQNNQMISRQERINQTVKLFTFAPFQAFKNVYSQDVENELAQASMHNIFVQDPTGSTFRLPTKLEEAQEIVSSDPNSAHFLFDKETFSAMNVINSLREGYSGDNARAWETFLMGKENLKSPDIKNRVDEQVGYKVNELWESSIKIPNLTGGNDTVNLGRNGTLIDFYRNNMTYLIASGITESEADRMTKTMFSKSFTVYRDCPIPKVIFNGIASDDPYSIAYDILDTRVREIANRQGIEVDNLTISYSNEQRCILVLGHGVNQRVYVEEINDKANAKLQSMFKKQAENNNLSKEEFDRKHANKMQVHAYFEEKNRLEAADDYEYAMD